MGINDRIALAKHSEAMATYKWTPRGEGMPAPLTPFAYTKDTQYTGVPYSSTKHVGKTIGEEISFSTFEAALANPQSVLFTEDLSDYGDLDPGNATTYYGVVCSKLTSAGLGHGVAVLSRFHGPNDPGDPDNRIDCFEMHEQTATDYDVDVTPPQIGDILWYPGHTRIITDVSWSTSGVTQVEICEAVRNTARRIYTSAAGLTTLLNAADPEYGLLRIANLAAFRGDNERWLFPQYDYDDIRTINTTLLLDRGDWVPYTSDQPVKFNVLDDTVRKVIIETNARHHVETIATNESGVLVRALTVGDYYAFAMWPGRDEKSQHCEFAVVDTALELPDSPITAASDFDVAWNVSNATPRFVFIRCLDDITKRYFFYLSDAHRAAGQITIPGGTVDYTGSAWIVLVSEHRLGRVSSIDNAVSFA